MLNKNNSMLLVIDMQKKLVQMLGDRANDAIQNSKKLVHAANILNIKTILTEQYPKGLLPTIEPIKEVLGENTKIFEKTNFSCLKEKEILQEIENAGKKQVVIFGIEAHICVYQTVLELLEKGFEVFVVSNLCYSRCDEEKQIAMQNLAQKGASIVSLEMALFMWLENSKNPHFKEIQALIK